MANKIWIGGASAVAQVDTFTLQNDFNDSETDITITLTDENGDTQTESIVPSGTDESVIAAALHTELSNSTQSLFTQITWSVVTTAVSGTAKVSGKPFYAASSVTGGAGSIVDTTPTASAGPNDLATAANWSSSGKPSTGDTVAVVPNPTDGVSYSMLYGLDQSAVALNSFSTSEVYTGTVGDPNNSYFLKYDVNNGTNPRVTLAGRAVAVWLSGTMTAVNVRRTSNREDAVKLDGTITDLRVAGSNVVGWVTAIAGCQVTNIYATNIPGRVIMGSGNTALAIVRLVNAYFDCDSVLLTTTGTFDQHGGTCIWRPDDTGTGNTWTLTGGDLDIRGAGDMDSLTVIGGNAFNTNSEVATKTISAASVYATGILDMTGPTVVTFTAAPNNYGGTVKGVPSTSELE